MLVVTEAGLLVAALILLIPIAVLFLECGLAALSRSNLDPVSGHPKPRVA
ncbi:glycosyl transferase, partial [filamentous cyanobacterium CCP1]